MNTSNLKKVIDFIRIVNFNDVKLPLLKSISLFNLEILYFMIKLFFSIDIMVGGLLIFLGFVGVSDIHNNCSNQQETTFVDVRDGESYNIITIGTDTWMAENLRYQAPGSLVYSDSLVHKYGRLYTITAAQLACPDRWHLATEREWNNLEIEHGMPAQDSILGGWRGEHAPSMRASFDWPHPELNTNTLGFKVLPAGYYFDETVSDWQGFDGLGYSAAFWSSTIDGVGYARFMFDEKNFVNKWPDTYNDSGASLSCRCVKDK